MKLSVHSLRNDVLGLDNEPVKWFFDSSNVPRTFQVREAFRLALNANFQGEELGFEKKMERFELSKRLWSSETDVEVKPEEQVLLKTVVGKYFPQNEVIGFLQAVIEPTEAPANVDDKP